MGENQNTEQVDQATFDMTSCMAMMEKMMAGHREGCDCDELFPQITSQEGIPEEWLKVMSQMMEVYCGTPQEKE